ncbi:MAG: hypothetical protein KME18_03280 [Phormidium tanganyikae FI6-MK23]|jgi:hypothetical protein|nr:hypothetical protein [Phormidium tanganyikae FI6-MK23]
MRKRHWINAGIAVLLASCQSNRTAQKVQPSPQAFAQPIVPAQSATLPAIKVPGMIPTSDSKVSLMPVAVSSTRDPFAATTIPTDLKATIQPAAQKPNAERGASIAAKSSIVTPPVVSLPQPVIRYAPIPQPEPLLAPALPIMPPPMPPVSRTNFADAIALTGVIQTGSQLSAIVQDSDGSSRYVRVGESLASGQVTVKKINLNRAGDPSIVLLQNGVELIKTVGRSEGSVAQTL